MIRTSTGTRGKRRWQVIGAGCIVVVILMVAGVIVGRHYAARQDRPAASQATPVQPSPTASTDADTTGHGPLAGRRFYVDSTRPIVQLSRQYQAERAPDAAIVSRAAAQPNTTWLTGPGVNDPQATKDIQAVTRTSTEAAASNTVPIYQLYALPGRDACAGYSKNGFTSDNAYLDWVDRIIGALKTKAVFSIEADGIAHTLQHNCMTPTQIADRYRLLNDTVTRLSASPNVLGAYLDAGHSEWFPDPKVLVEPLRKAGIDKARGVAVNVSFFVATPDITGWSQRLVAALGDAAGDKGVIIDTSRNGKGVPAPSVTGEARWCNPAGRGLGLPPTTTVADAHIDAYFWGKNIGESDGSCFGHAPAGTFEPAALQELARNAQQ